MRRLLISLVLAGLLGATVLLSAGATAATSCGGHVTVTGGTSCRKAKSIVAEYKKTRKRHIQGFNCTGKKSGGRITVVDCRLQEKRIHWKA
jgi:hypothetical protein